MQNLIKSEMCSSLFIPTKSELKHIIAKNNAAPKDGLNTRDLHEKIRRIGYLKPFYREICTRNCL